MKRQLLSVSHSYVVGLNRRLAHEMARAAGTDVLVTISFPAVRVQRTARLTRDEYELLLRDETLRPLLTLAASMEEQRNHVIKAINAFA